MSYKYTEYEMKYYKQLNGYTMHFSQIDEEGFPQFVLQKKNKEALLFTLSCDAEGNERGFAFIEPLERE
tara:strand:+ start:33 stop:239 length:207 start_codon:yes stop_codon:yes gene_type:complete